MANNGTGAYGNSRHNGGYKFTPDRSAGLRDFDPSAPAPNGGYKFTPDRSAGLRDIGSVSEYPPGSSASAVEPPTPPASIAAPTRTPAPITMVAGATMPGSAPARSATDQAILDGTYVAPAPTNALPPPPVAAPTPAAPAVTDHNPFFANLIDRGLSSFKGMFDGVAKQYAALHAPQPQGGGVGTIGANGLNPQQLESVVTRYPAQASGILAADRGIKEGNAGLVDSQNTMRQGIAQTALNTDPYARENPLYNAEAIRQAALRRGGSGDQVGSMGFTPGAADRLRFAAQQSRDAVNAGMNQGDFLRDTKERALASYQQNLSPEGIANSELAQRNLEASRTPEARAAEKIRADESMAATMERRQAAQDAQALQSGRDVATREAERNARNVVRQRNGLAPLPSGDESPDAGRRLSKEESRIKLEEFKQKNINDRFERSIKDREEARRVMQENNNIVNAIRTQANNIKQVLDTAGLQVNSQIGFDKIMMDYRQQRDKMVQASEDNATRLRAAAGSFSAAREAAEKVIESQAPILAAQLAEMDASAEAARNRWETIRAGLPTAQPQAPVAAPAQKSNQQWQAEGDTPKTQPQNWKWNGQTWQHI